jgi:hypothetical protein
MRAAETIGRRETKRAGTSSVPARQLCGWSKCEASSLAIAATANVPAWRVTGRGGHCDRVAGRDRRMDLDLLAEQITDPC